MVPSTSKRMALSSKEEGKGFPMESSVLFLATTLEDRDTDQSLRAEFACLLCSICKSPCVQHIQMKLQLLAAVDDDETQSFRANAGDFGRSIWLSSAGAWDDVQRMMVCH